MKKIYHKAIKAALALLALPFVMNVHAQQQDASHYYKKIHTPEHEFSGKIEVIYYFNPNCQSCKNFSEHFQAWKKVNKHNLVITEESFSPFDDWKWASKAFYVARKIDPNITEKQFKDAHEISKVGAITDILRAADTVSIATGYSRGKIMALLADEEAEKYTVTTQESAKKYGVFGVPAVVIRTESASYRVSPEFKLTYTGMLNVTNALIAYQETRTNQ